MHCGRESSAVRTRDRHRSVGDHTEPDPARASVIDRPVRAANRMCRWEAVLKCRHGGGTGIVPKGGKHTGTRPYRLSRACRFGVRTAKDDASPLRQVLPLYRRPSFNGQPVSPPGTVQYGLIPVSKPSQDPRSEKSHIRERRDLPIFFVQFKQSGIRRLIFYEITLYINISHAKNDSKFFSESSFRTRLRKLLRFL